MLNRLFKSFIFLTLIVVMTAYPLHENSHVLTETPVSMKFRIRSADAFSDRAHTLYLIPEPTAVVLPGRTDSIIRCRYAVLQKGRDGFGKVVDLRSDPPMNGEYYVPTMYYGCRKNSFGIYEHRIRLPFQNIRIHQLISGKAVARLNRKIDTAPESFTVAVKIFSRGAFLVDDLLIDGIPFMEWIRKNEN